MFTFMWKWLNIITSRCLYGGVWPEPSTVLSDGQYSRVTLIQHYIHVILPILHDICTQIFGFSIRECKCFFLHNFFWYIIKIGFCVRIEIELQMIRYHQAAFTFEIGHRSIHGFDISPRLFILEACPLFSINFNNS